jgi:hypothetical protein
MMKVKQHRLYLQIRQLIFDMPTYSMMAIVKQLKIYKKNLKLLEGNNNYSQTLLSTIFFLVIQFYVQNEFHFLLFSVREYFKINI